MEMDQRNLKFHPSGSRSITGGAFLLRKMFMAAYGQVVTIKDADQFKQLGITDLESVCRSTPALANGDLYLRTAQRLFCIKGHKE